MSDPRAPSSKIELRVLRGHHTAVVREDVSQSQVSEAIGRMLRLVNAALQRQGVLGRSGPFARYHTWDEIIDLEAGVIVDTPILPDGDVVPGELPAGPAAIAIHAGAYETLSATYDAIRRWLEATPGHEPNGGPWELYLTDPSTEPNADRWLTEVIFPLKPNTQIS